MARTIRNERRWKNRALVRERDARRARRLWLTLALLVGALLPAGFYLYEQNTCLQLSYEIESIEGQREQLAEAERRLKVRHADVASMQRIERWAARQQLTRPSAEEIVIVPYEDPGSDTMLARAPDGAQENARRAKRFE